MPRRKKVSFEATIKAPKKVKVVLSTKRGEKVSFRAVKKVPKKVKLAKCSTKSIKSSDFWRHPN